MMHVEKTVFLSYRRTNIPWALAIFQSLNHNGYDVFFDFNGIASGDFESVILGNITARAHFVVLLTPSALERCGDPGDWLRHEIETALTTRRNIVPLMLEGFDFNTPSIANQLTGALAPLKHYNALRIPAEYFEEAMERLRSRYLNIPLDTVLHPASSSAQKNSKEQQAAAVSAPLVREKELTAQEWFERGLNSSDREAKFDFYTEAIRLKPDYAAAFNNRGNVRQAKGDLDGAIQDYNEAIRLKPDHTAAFNNRGLRRAAKGDLDGAIRDYTEAIRLKPDLAEAFNNRGIARQGKGDLDGAIQDYNGAIRLRPDYADALNNRGVARQAKGDLDGAIQDYNGAIGLKSDYADALYNRGSALHAKNDLNGAIQDYTEAILLKPDYANAFHNRGMARKANGDLAGALEDQTRAKNLEDGNRIK